MHDLNNQLAVILNYANFVIEDTAADDPRRADLLEIDKYAKTKRIDVDAGEQAKGAEWLQRIEEENAGELTPERLAKLEAEKARADADAIDEALLAGGNGVKLDEAASPTEGRRFSRA